MDGPRDLLQLIAFPAGVSDFQTALGTPLWWDHLEQGRLFLLTKFTDAAAALGGCQKPRHLSPYVGKALHDLRNHPHGVNWRNSFRTPGWDALHTTQLRSAMHQAGMQLVKSALAIVTLEHCIKGRKDLSSAQKTAHVQQLYKDVRIAPAFYTLGGFDETFYSSLSENQQAACAQRILADCGIPSGRNVLTEMSRGHHVTYEVAQAIRDELTNPHGHLTIMTARRATHASKNAAKMGNVKPACRSFRQP